MATSDRINFKWGNDMNITKLCAEIQAGLSWRDGEGWDSNPYHPKHQAEAYRAFALKWEELQRQSDDAYPREVA